MAGWFASSADLPAVRTAPGQVSRCNEETSHAIVTSADGTKIAYEQQGSGPPLIIVDGALSTRGGGKAALRALLAPQVTVFGFDRRGRATAAIRSRTRWTGRLRTSRR
jgi:hypothetical protein